MLIQPEELKTLEQKVEDARNLLTNLEQDYLRIQRLRVSEEYSLGELNKAKSEINQMIKTLTEEKELLETEVKQGRKTKESINSDIRELADKLKRIESDTEKSLSRNEEVRSDFLSKGVALAQREETVTKREQAVTVSEGLAFQKHSKIKDFANSL